jgi:hypothetical protein
MRKVAVEEALRGVCNLKISAAESMTATVVQCSEELSWDRLPGRRLKADSRPE